MILITRDLCCSAFVKDAAEDLMDQYGGGGGGEGVSTYFQKENIFDIMVLKRKI